MINGAHSILYSSNPEADRAFLRDVFGLPHVDVGRGWLIFGLPPSELAVHPSATGEAQGFFFMCEDIEALIADLRQRRIECSEPHDAGWGILTQVTMPGGGRLGVYQPRHERPAAMGQST